MSAGKSTLALQVEHTWAEAGRRGLLLTSHDRGGSGVVTPRLGMRRPAAEVAPGTDLTDLLAAVPDGGFVVADEAQFSTPEQVDALARLHARLVDGVVVRQGAQVLLGDTASAESTLFGPAVRYQVLCRRHGVRRETTATG